jgi:Na+/proline symporter
VILEKLQDDGRLRCSYPPTGCRIWYELCIDLQKYILKLMLGVVVGVGFFFAFLMMGISWLQNRYTMYSTKQSEEFNTASRSVKPGLIASGIVSAWTWAATLLQSSTVGYRYGVAGPFWYAAGATVQILMFAVLACKTKQNAPRCHTYLEIIYARYGRVAHIIFMVFAFVTNILVGSQLLLGGSAVVTSLTGMNVYAAIFLIPTGMYRMRLFVCHSLTVQVSVPMSFSVGFERRFCVTTPTP